ncbi:MAG: glycosyltransferase family 1 protein [archaeon]|jgi:glycosyltransferase involved in cell wall biosynthesis
MKVLFDHQAFSNQTYGGTSRYFFELLTEIHSKKLCEFELPLIFSNNAYLKSSQFTKPLPFLHEVEFTGKRRLLNVINNHKSMDKLNVGNFDVFHPTHYNPYFLYSLGEKPFVITVYDMIHERFPEQFSKLDKTSAHKRLLANKADKILAISKNTKKDLVEYLGIDPKKVVVTPLATSMRADKNAMAKIGPSFALPKKFILFVGVRAGYKNFNLFFESISSLLKKTEVSLVCVGGGKFSSTEQELFEKSGLVGKVLQFSVSDSELPLFYSKALFFAFPSLYEGFGIPILEAFSCGCPVVLSKASCFPEVAEKAALYFDPTDKNSIKNSVERLLSDEKLRSILAKKGKERAKEFSWNKTAKQTVEVYKSLV